MYVKQEPHVEIVGFYILLRKDPSKILSKMVVLNPEDYIFWRHGIDKILFFRGNLGIGVALIVYKIRSSNILKNEAFDTKNKNSLANDLLNASESFQKNRGDALFAKGISRSSGLNREESNRGALGNINANASSIDRRFDTFHLLAYSGSRKWSKSSSAKNLSARKNFATKTR